MASDSRTVRFTFAIGLVVVSLLAGLCVSSCGGGSSGGGGSSSAPPVPPTPLPPVVTTAITQFADDPLNPGVQVIVTSASTPAAGAFIVISGSTVPAYDGTYAVVSATATTFTIAAVFTTTATAFWQSGGGVIPGCVTTGDTSAISLSYVPSRFTGAAPLAVFFDATATTATATPRPFHELEYRWSFGDTGSGTWATGSHAGTSTPSSRNGAKGPIAAHVYENPGTYIVSLDITGVVAGVTKTVSNACVQVTVLDPNVVFAGANTTCFSTSGNFANCPTGATPVTTSDFVAVINSATAGNTVRRLLLRRGEIFSAAAIATLKANGPGIIGAFGAAGAPPIIRTTANDLMLELSSNKTPNIGDWRIMDLDFDGQSAPASKAIQSGGGINQVTLLRLSLRDTHTGLQMLENVLDLANTGAGGAVIGHVIYDQIALVDSTIARIVGGSGGYGVFVSGTRFATMGNLVDDSSAAEHLFRTGFMVKGVISNNTLNKPASGKAHIKMHAPTFGSGGVVGGGFTDLNIVADNKFTNPDSLSVVLGPQTNNVDERVRNIITEGNYWVFSGPTAQQALVLEGTEMTVRNNIFDLTTSGGHTCIFVQQHGAPSAPIPDQIRIFHNTCFSGDPGATSDTVALDATATNVTVVNNLGVVPAGTLMRIVSGTGGGGLIQSNNLATSTPGFLGPLTTADGFKLTAGSGPTIINAGAAVPVFSDFYSVTRPVGPSNDLGAAEF